MTIKRTCDEKLPHRSSDGTSGSTPPGPGWEKGDFDLDDIDLDPMLEMQIELPMYDENFVNGEPRLTVDYFGFSNARRDAIVARLHRLAHTVFDYGADLPRFLLFEGPCADGNYDTRDLIAIICVRKREVRVETVRADITDPVRSTVESALGDSVRHLRRRSENQIAW